METIEATYRIVTPMFIGGADQKPTDGIRPPSFKGVLRFWWRALNWSQFYNANQCSEADALKALHNEEVRLFGGSAEQGGQGVFLLSVATHADHGKLPEASPWHQYLLGLGLYKFKKGYLRQGIPGGSIDVKLAFKPGNNQLVHDRKQIERAMMAAGIFGGLGSRSRKGFGSIAIETITGSDWVAPKKVAELVQTIREISDSSLAVGQPPISSFSHISRVDISAVSNNAAWEVLKTVGKELQMYRGYGNARGGAHMVNGLPAEQNFADDHDLIMTASNAAIHAHPKRAVFGLPHNYFFSSSRQKADLQPTHQEGNRWESKTRSRRASPLFIHIHPVQEGYVAVQSLLPAQFLPDADRIEIKSRMTSRVEADVDYAVIEGYLDRFANRTEVLKS